MLNFSKIAALPCDFENCVKMLKAVSDMPRISGFEQTAALGQINEKVLNFAFDTKNYWAVYSLWTTLGKLYAENKLPKRGPLLDLWDGYNEKAHNCGEDCEINPEIVATYVSRSFEKLNNLLRLRRFSENSFLDEIRSLIVRLNDLPEDDEEFDRTERILTSLLDLASHYFGKQYIDDNMKALFQQQVGEFEKAKRLLQNSLLKPLSRIFADRDSHLEWQREFAKVLVCLNSYETPAPDGVALLKHWAAEWSEPKEEESGKCNRFFKKFVGDKFGIEMKEKQPKALRPAPMPTSSKLDNDILLMGRKDVGKTHFLFASEHITLDGERGCDLSETFLKNSLRRGFEDAQDWSEEGMKIWRGENPDADGQLRERAFHKNDNRYKAESVKSNLCNFRIYDPPGETIQQEGNEDFPQWFARTIDDTKYNGIIAMVDPSVTRENIEQEYLPVFSRAAQKMKSLCEEKKDSYENGFTYPLYFLINKYDEILPSPDVERDAEAVESLKNYFESNNGFVFGDYGDFRNFDSVREIVRNASPICADAAFQQRLLQDLETLEPLIRQALEKAVFQDISIVYSKSLFDPDGKYTPIRALWTDLTARVFEATKKCRADYIREEFIEYIKRNYEEIDSEIFGGLTDFDSGFADNDMNLPKYEKLEDEIKSFASGTDEHTMEFVKGVERNLQAIEKKLKEKCTELQSILEEVFEFLLDVIGVPVNLDEYFKSKGLYELPDMPPALNDQSWLGLEYRLFFEGKEDDSMRQHFDNNKDENGKPVVSSRYAETKSFYVTYCKAKDSALEREEYALLGNFYDTEGRLKTRKLLESDADEIGRFCDLLANFDRQNRFGFHRDYKFDLKTSNVDTILGDTDVYKFEILKENPDWICAHEDVLDAMKVVSEKYKRLGKLCDLHADRLYPDLCRKIFVKCLEQIGFRIGIPEEGIADQMGNYKRKASEILEKIAGMFPFYYRRKDYPAAKLEEDLTDLHASPKLKDTAAKRRLAGEIKNKVENCKSLLNRLIDLDDIQHETERHEQELQTSDVQNSVKKVLRKRNEMMLRERRKYLEVSTGFTVPDPPGEMPGVGLKFKHHVDWLRSLKENDLEHYASLIKKIESASELPETDRSEYRNSDSGEKDDG